MSSRKTKAHNWTKNGSGPVRIDILTEITGIEFPDAWRRKVASKSLMDYLFRWLELRFLKPEQGILFELPSGRQLQTEVGRSAKAPSGIVNLGDAPICQFCGSLMVRNGSCHRCMECGGTSGCS